jgi:hypothetical protein
MYILHLVLVLKSFMVIYGCTITLPTPLNPEAVTFSNLCITFFLLLLHYFWCEWYLFLFGKFVTNYNKIYQEYKLLNKKS